MDIAGLFQFVNAPLWPRLYSVTSTLIACFRINLNVMTLHIESHNVYTQLGVAVSVNGVAQVRLM